MTGITGAQDEASNEVRPRGSEDAPRGPLAEEAAMWAGKVLQWLGLAGPRKGKPKSEVRGRKPGVTETGRRRQRVSGTCVFSPCLGAWQPISGHVPPEMGLPVVFDRRPMLAVFFDCQCQRCRRKA